ncbi:hypothetical protein [Bifidobacterium oedipodis]|uniref:UDP-N-acetylmuramyl peptide synthase n=1 Tax=Bifidobacterium oedipodis TaxID=2675322 RepID=A0A7Y0EMI1_9BIFI|nr:hypothetical protein [Bifidobacterium sp. DSM 109957]NMM92948.1 hypothetical protein [Bifidobacterium sp. DSM 109957]
MSAVSESIAQRTTLGLLADHYGCQIEPAFATNVTVTSLCDTVDSIIPGALFVCSEHIADIERAAQRGAYAVLVPRQWRDRCPQTDIPLVFGDISDHMLGDLASKMAGTPSNVMAVFALTGADALTLNEDVNHLADFLHMLGNPVAVISAAGSQSMTRKLDLTYPLGVIEAQRALSVCAEDGVAAVILALDDATFTRHALESVNVDVLGSRRVVPIEEAAGIKARYAFETETGLKVTTMTAESDELSREAPQIHYDGKAEGLSLVIAMVLAAGVRKNNVRSALRVASNLK